MSSTQTTSVFFTDVPLFVEERSLRKHFESVGHITDFRLLGPPVGKDFRYGFAEYLDSTSAEEAIARLNGTSFGGRPMKVMSAAATRGRKRQRQQNASHQQQPAPRGGMTFPRGYTDPVLGRDDTSIFECLQGMQQSDAYEAVEQLRVLVLERKNEARKLLENNPALRLAVVMILQHAGRLPFGPLPPEAIQHGGIRVDAPVPAAPAEGEGEKVEPPREQNDEIIEILSKLSEEEVERIVSMTDEDLNRIPDLSQRQQIGVLRERLLELAADLE
ncbi:RBP39 [Trypanosoma brucei gambiense DAL972]|uniref:RNA-binding protein, putative n=1 Tax=Trypanosoma brucei gambiense (strain MHOM/CI/86/DAL972) TaxID=679716 RepID=D0AAA2_TRYB9|nr:RBP39 [Trypanosoma brucei gambiense DAL972]CBH18603.1 RBP39 [Trypanosoma brucei gambiense DAL972]|eukprot:XP_011780867.1 RBP39 [Trypanosoma brucei gambiense DAL972]